MQAKGHQPDILCAISYAGFYFWKDGFLFIAANSQLGRSNLADDASIQASSKLFAAEDCFLLFAAHRFRVSNEFEHRDAVAKKKMGDL